MADDSAATQQLLVSSTGDGEQTSASQGTPAALVTPLRLPSTSVTAQSDGSGQETTPTLMVSSASGLATSSASPPASGGMSTAATGSSSASTSSAVSGGDSFAAGDHQYATGSIESTFTAHIHACLPLTACAAAGGGSALARVASTPQSASTSQYASSLTPPTRPVPAFGTGA
ncbi:hypothetical protein PF008_g14572 [Phytophthora fragariae]|uniref:Uncharacterized protein n=1 Tax=Phytophthora fragariae TaxID=53985 RepID=A0A6G0RGM6_9STRA|nr:hypothetical protein PF008_g14572 [Phytophthora fragariae]